jgi:two-component system, OmpR family, sensor kinase
MTGPRVHTMWERASLRGRVLLLAVALLAVGFTAFSLVTGNALRSYMEDRVDAQLRASAKVFTLLPATVARTGAERTPPAGLAGFSTDVLGNPVITYVSSDGTVEGSIDSLAGDHRTRDATGPALPPLGTAAVTAHQGRPFTVDGTEGDTRWRVIAVPRFAPAVLRGTAETDRGSVVVATSLAEVDGTVDKMWRIYEIAGLCLLGVLAAAGWFAVRSGLHPLTRIEQTAAEIAGGDLSRRVPELAGPNTEIGRLAAALNGMLGQLETAFAARAGSEARMSRFVADASHELRTPLAGIKGLTDLHRMGALSGQRPTGHTDSTEHTDSTGHIDSTEHTEHTDPTDPIGGTDDIMARIARESERLTRLVEDMLLLARLDGHALEPTGDSGFPLGLDLAPTDLRTLAADALHVVRALDATRPVALTGPDGGGPPGSAPALADEARLRQVVTNLVGNAVTHTPPGTPIRIGVGTVGEHTVLEVVDQGPGLTAEQSGLIFDRFYRADTSRTRATGGAGLGLAIVRSLVTAHGGRVEVHSAPGHGATFRVLLPRGTEHLTDRPAVPSAPRHVGEPLVVRR